MKRNRIAALTEGLPPTYAAAIAVNGFLIILVTIPVSNMAAKWPRFETVAISAALLGAGFGFTALATNLPLFAISVALWTLGEIAATSVSPAIIADLSPVRLRGLYQGIFGAAWGLSYFIGPLAGGCTNSSEAPPFGLAAWSLGLILSLCYLALRVPARKRMFQGNSPAD